MKYLKEYSSYKSELKKGISVETEHGDIFKELSQWASKHKLKLPWNEKDFYKKIAKAHLKELPDYYTRLKDIETIKEYNFNADDNSYMNCDSFCNKMVGDFKSFDKVNDKRLRIGKIMPLNKLPELESVLQDGDVIAFGDPRLPRHYALYIGNGEVYEVEQWGAKPRKYSLESNIKEYEGIAAVYRK